MKFLISISLDGPKRAGSQEMITDSYYSSGLVILEFAYATNANSTANSIQNDNLR